MLGPWLCGRPIRTCCQQQQEMMDTNNEKSNNSFYQNLTSEQLQATKKKGDVINAMITRHTQLHTHKHLTTTILSFLNNLLLAFNNVNSWKIFADWQKCIVTKYFYLNYFWQNMNWSWDWTLISHTTRKSTIKISCIK